MAEERPEEVSPPSLTLLPPSGPPLEFLFALLWFGFKIIGPGSFRGCEAGHCFHWLSSSSSFSFFLHLVLFPRFGETPEAEKKEQAWAELCQAASSGQVQLNCAKLYCPEWCHIQFDLILLLRLSFNYVVFHLGQLPLGHFQFGLLTFLKPVLDSAELE